ncbi:MAG: 4-hydroxy-tetrahydrodipicolinate synthase [Methylobacteriaceae bacterium]|jgi:4-hydroxy-tetrahydrodipicolinate synthase|nr:4-hydroxy-tetrahydrodipicolinate synthase [Methylobacteriaceae bacterium]
MFTPKGIIVPIITPMNDDESFNEAQFRIEINRLIDGGVSGIFALGTNGEVYALTEDEKLKVLKVAVDEVKGRVPVYAGTGCIGTRETVEMSKKAEGLGVNALSVVSPYFVAVSQDDIYRHFSAVAKSVTLPILLYNMPARTGNNINYQTVKKLAEENPNIVGAKDSSGNFDNTLRYIENTGGRLAVLAGNDSLILWTLLAGGTGAIAGWANVFPKLICSIYDNWAKGDIEAANTAQRAIRPFRDVMALGNPNSVVKRCLNLLGHPVGPAREPASGTDPKIDAALKAACDVYKE